MKKINEFIKLLEGRKTYLISILTAIYVLLQAFGFVDFTPEQEQAINLLILALFGASLRSGMTK